MARSKETFNKRDREAKKQKKLLEKKNKAEERKAEKKSGNLEDMMAYLDENGNLTDSPPDPSLKKEIQAEDIRISVPRLEEREEEPETAITGTVSFLNKSKGFGFINETRTGERIFFHVSELLQPVMETDQVTFRIGRGPRGPQAMEISKLG